MTVSRRAALLAALPVAGVAALFGGAQPAQASAAENIRGGCIRFYSGGPEWHINEMHQTVGINLDTLKIEGSDIVFNLSSSQPVISAFATADETLVSRGIAAGISGGVNKCVIRFAKDGRRLYLNNSADYRLLVGDNANLWVTIVSVR